jgi:hypothetical protein
MSPESERLKAARASGSLTNVIGALREDARTEAANASPPAREQVDIVDGSLRLANHLAGQGTKGAERRQAMNSVQPGTTVTARGAAKTLLTREQKLDRVKTWATTLTEEQRTEYLIGEQYGALSENAQDVIAEAFGEIEDKAYSDSIGIADYDFDQETVDVDALEDDETDESYVDPVDEASLNGETYYYTEESQ